MDGIELIIFVSLGKWNYVYIFKYNQSLFYSPLGIPITQFCLPVEQEVVTSKDGEILTEKDYAFFICLGSSMSQLSLTCPLRVDKYANRRSLSFTIEDESVRIAINMFFSYILLPTYKNVHM